MTQNFGQAPANELRALFGATQAAVPRVAPPHYTQAFRIERQVVRVTESAVGSAEPIAITQTVPLTSTTARPLATFADGTAALTETSLGNGRLISLGFWPGVSYWLSPDRTEYDHLPTDWSSAARQFATWPARSANAARHIIVSPPGVEACLLESPAGLAVTLLNWTGQPIQALRVTIPGSSAFKHAVAVEAGSLQPTLTDNGVQFVLPLQSADVLLLER